MADSNPAPPLSVLDFAGLRGTGAHLVPHWISSNSLHVSSATLGDWGTDRYRVEQPTRANPTPLKDVARQHTVVDKQTHQIGYLRNTTSKNRRQIWTRTVEWVTFRNTNPLDFNKSTGSRVFFSWKWLGHTRWHSPLTSSSSTSKNRSGPEY